MEHHRHCQPAVLWHWQYFLVKGDVYAPFHERNFAEQLEFYRDGFTAAPQVNADVGVQWPLSFLSAEAIREAARRQNLPADVIIEVGSEPRPGITAAEAEKIFEMWSSEVGSEPRAGAVRVVGRGGSGKWLAHRVRFIA